jgi:hypothetical protein
MRLIAFKLLVLFVAALFHGEGAELDHGHPVEVYEEAPPRRRHPVRG